MTLRIFVFASVYRQFTDRKMFLKRIRKNVYDYGQPRKNGRNTRMHSKEFPWAQYKPKDGILVVQPVWITEREIQFLMQLYAPFIGKEATLLYATLYGELSPSEYESEVFSF